MPLFRYGSVSKTTSRELVGDLGVGETSGDPQVGTRYGVPYVSEGRLQPLTHSEPDPAG